MILLIPCIEVFRFYFCSSDAISTQLLGDGINNGRVTTYKTTQYRQAKLDGTDTVWLSKYLNNEDNVTAARIALYEEAFRTARYVRSSILTDKERNKSKMTAGYPTCFVPFNDQSQIEAQVFKMGKVELANEFNGFEVSIVKRITSCSHPFLENGFYWSRDNDADKANSEDAKPRDGSSPPRDNPKDDPDPGISNNNSGNPKAKKHSHHVRDKKFPNGPTEDVIIRIIKEKQKTVNIAPVPKNEDFEGSTFNKDTSSDSKSAPIKVTSSEEPEPKQMTEAERKTHEEYNNFYNELIALFIAGEQPDKKMPGQDFDISQYELEFNIGNHGYDKRALNFASGYKMQGKKLSWKGKRKVKLTAITYHQNGSSRFLRSYLLDVLPRIGSADSYGMLLFLHNEALGKIAESTFQEIFLMFSKKQKIELNQDEFRDLIRLKFKRSFKVGPKPIYIKILKHLEKQ